MELGHDCLVGRPSGNAPTFLVAALRDPVGANLNRYQIVKGWVDAKGEVQEKIYDVAWSGARKPGADGKLPPVGTTVDVANATWTNTIGAPELIAVWKARTSIPSSERSTMAACWRFRPRAGPLTTRNTRGSNSPLRCRCQSRSARTPRRSGTRPRSRVKTPQRFYQECGSAGRPSPA